MTYMSASDSPGAMQIGFDWSIDWFINISDSLTETDKHHV